MSTNDRIKYHQVAGWQESDYLDYADFENAIENDKPVSFALCQWLIRQSHGNDGDGFTYEEWQDWYFYALEHCPRFAQEQPRRRQADENRTGAAFIVPRTRLPSPYNTRYAASASQALSCIVRATLAVALVRGCACRYPDLVPLRSPW